MPTVHLSLPTKVYNELKERAAEMGIQVTDIIKLYITKGLQEGLVGNNAASGDYVSREEFESLLSRVDELEKKLRRLLISYRILEGKFHELDSEVDFLYKELEKRFDEVMARLYEKALQEEELVG